MTPRRLRIAVLSLVGAFLLIQLVPYGRHHTNPSGTQEPNWDSARTERLVVASCYDCHSDRTRWPWYTDVAPFSWLTQRDVDQGRTSLNFSEWDRLRAGEGDIVTVIQNGSMPPWIYTLIHPDARLSATDRAALIAGIRRTFEQTLGPGSPTAGVAGR